MADGPEFVFQLKITLQDIQPPVWRRVLVPDDTTLIGLHRVIQAAMGWEDYHLWRFEIGDTEYGEELEGGWGEPIESARDARLNQVAEPGDMLLYEYDFGDSWEHRVRVEKVLPAAPGARLPRVRGRRAGWTAGRQWWRVGLRAPARGAGGPDRPRARGADRRG